MAAPAVSVRYLVSDVTRAADFYVDVLGFDRGLVAGDAFAEVTRGGLRLLLSGPKSSGARASVAVGVAGSGGANRFQHVVGDLDAELDRLAGLGVEPLGAAVEGPGGRQALLADPDGNLVEVFQPASTS